MEKKKPSKEELAAAKKKAAAAKKAAEEKKSARAKKEPAKKAPSRAKVEDEVEEELEEEVETTGKKKMVKKISVAERKKVKGLRIGAIILWVLAIAAEVGAFFAFSFAVRNNVSAMEFPNALDRIGQFLNSYGLASKEMMLVILALVVDAICCITAAILWKKSNKISPCLASSKLVRTIWHQLGVIMVLVCFVPIGIFMLVKSDKLDKKTRTALLAIFLALFVGATATSVDYKQPSEEEVAQLQQEAIDANAEGEVYWTRYGKSYHFEEECHTLARSNPDNLFTGSLEDAFNSNRWDPCDYCSGGGEVE